MAAPAGIDPRLLPTFSIAAAGRKQQDEERSPFRAGLVRLGAELSNNIPLLVEKAAGTLTPEKEADYQAGLRRGLARSDQLLPGGAMSIDQVRSLGDIGTLIKENLLYSVPQMGANIAGALIARGRPLTGATLAGTPGFVGSNITRATEGGTQPLASDAAFRSVAVAPAQAGLDVMAERFLPFAGKIFGPAAATQTGGFLKRTAKSIGKASVTEAVTETAQQVGERFAAGLVLTDRDAAREYVQSFGTAFFVGGAMGSFGGFRKPQSTPVSGPDAPNEELTETIDRVLGLPPPGKTSVTARDQFVVDPQGVAQTALNESYNAAIPATPQRPLEGLTGPELQSAFNALVGRKERSTEQQRMFDLVQAELEQRGVKRSETETDASSVTEAVEPGLTDVSGGAGSDFRAPASTPTWESQRSELLKGVATRKAYLDAKDPDDLRERLRARLEAGSEAKSDFLLAERLGIDTNAPAAPLATETQSLPDPTLQAPVATRSTTTPAPAAPASQEGGDPSAQAEFKGWWKEQRKGKAVRALKPTSFEDLDRKIYRELGEPRNTATLFTKGDELENLAREREIIDGQGQLTDKGVELSLSTPIPMQEAVRAATKQGFKGAAASAFDRGAQAFVNNLKAPAFATGEERQAFMAGVDWAAERNSVPKTASNYFTERALEKQGGNEYIKRVAPSIEQRRQQIANSVIDAKAGQSDDIAALKRMVREGDIDGAMMGLQRVQRGERLFSQPPRGEVGFKGEVILRGAPRVQTSKYVVGKTKGQRRAEAEIAIRKFELSRSIDAAVESGIIDRKEQMRLVAKLRQGQFAEVANAVPVVEGAGAATTPAAERRARVQGLTEELEAIPTEDEVAELNPDENGVLRYRRGGEQGTLLAVDVAAQLQAITAQWKAKLNVEVVQNIDELDADIQAAIRSDQASDAHGFVRGDTVYLIADNLEDMDAAVATLYHEALGHMGLAKLFRGQLDTALEQMYRSNETLRRAVDIWRETNPNAYGGNLARAVEEVFAEMSQRGRAEASLLTKIATIIRAFARRIGLKLKFSDGEVAAILAMAHDQIVNGKQPSATIKGLRYMMSLWHGSPYDFDRFLTEKIGTGEGAQVYGWGLYFASAKDVGEYYRDTLAGRDVTIAEAREFLHTTPYDSLLDADDIRSISAQAGYMRVGSPVWRDLRQEYDEDWMDARREHGAFMARDGQVAEPNREQDLKRRMEYYRARIDALDALNRWVKSKKSAGKLYNVTVKALNDQFMDWFLPLNEQSKHVQDALKELGFNSVDEAALAKKQDELYAKIQATSDAIRRLHGEAADATPSRRGDLRRQIDELNKSQDEHWETMDELSKQLQQSNPAGADVYHIMRRRLGSAERASKALLGVGIRGNRYQDQFSRGKTDGTYNYVVFDASDIEIANKYSRPAELNEQTKRTVAQATSAFDRFLKTRTFKDKALKLLVGAMPMTHLVEHYKREFPAQQKLLDAQVNRRATTAVFSHLYDSLRDRTEKLMRTRAGEKVMQSVSELMELTAWDIDPTRPWEDNSHLKGLDNEATLKRLHADGQRKYNLLKANGQNRVYDEYRQLNEMEHYASMALAIRQLVTMDPEFAQTIAGFETDPVAVFRDNARLHDPAEARKYWRDVLQGSINAATDHIEALRGEDTTENARQSTRLNPLETYIKEVKKGLQAMDQSPYFHLGRFGEYFVSGRVRLGADKKADPAALEHVGRELAKLGVTARVSRDLTQPVVFLRMDSIEQRDAVFDLFHRLRKEGWLSQHKEHEISRGTREQGEWLPERTKQEMNRFVTALRSDPFFDATEGMSDKEKASLQSLKERIIHVAYDVWLDMLPDAATSKVLTHRESKPGFATDMHRSFAFRYNIGVNSIASLAAEPEINTAFEEMRGQLNEAKVTPGADVDTITTLYAEHARREAERPIASKQDGFDTWRAFTHAFYLGMSPSYVLVNLTQMGVLLWPELAKKHSFVDAAKAIAKVTPTAFKIISETAKHGYQAGGSRRAADSIITREVLDAALGGDKATAEFLSRMIGSGIIDIGSSARELARVAEGLTGKKREDFLRYMAAFGLYSETFTRLVAALAARDLHKGDADSTVDYATGVVRESMLEYSTWNTARFMGKMGVAGRFTPVMMSFLQYSVQVTWKLYREFYDAFLRKGSPQQQKEARDFLKGHLTAVTTLAGTLGMPFATVGAAAIEKLVDAFDDDEEPYDASAAWRNFLADTFGPDLGEMIARGAPRALGRGVDLSQRVGEQNLLPLSQFWADRRGWKDAAAEASLRSLGAPVSMGMSLFEGWEKLSNGDFLGGMQSMVPMAVRGPTKAFEMTEVGYTDANGNKLPIASPRAEAIMAQLLGFTPAQKADYSEAAGDKRARDTTLQSRAKVLRDGIVDALEKGDNDKVRDLVRETIKFDRANPGFAVLPDIERSFERRRRLQAVATATRTPIGTTLKDVGAQRLTSYANVEYQAR